MHSRRLLAQAAVAGIIALVACDGAGEHNVPPKGGEGLPASATLQDSAAEGQAVVDQGPVVAEEIKSPAPALPQGSANTPAAMDTVGGAPASGSVVPATPSAPTPR